MCNLKGGCPDKWAFITGAASVASCIISRAAGCSGSYFMADMPQHPTHHHPGLMINYRLMNMHESTARRVIWILNTLRNIRFVPTTFLKCVEVGTQLDSYIPGILRKTNICFYCITFDFPNSKFLELMHIIIQSATTIMFFKSSFYWNFSSRLQKISIYCFYCQFDRDGEYI